MSYFQIFCYKKQESCKLNPKQNLLAISHADTAFMKYGVVSIPYELPDAEGQLWIIKEPAQENVRIQQHGYDTRSFNSSSGNGSKNASVTVPLAIPGSLSLISFWDHWKKLVSDRCVT